jgi:hypothetical protein
LKRNILAKFSSVNNIIDKRSESGNLSEKSIEVLTVPIT